MITRRNFFRFAFFGLSFTILPKNLAFPFSSFDEKGVGNDNSKIFEEIIKKARKNQWDKLPIGDLITKIGLEFLDFPYIANTLDVSPQEKCVVTFEGFDCVTFFEVSLCLARILKKKKYTFEDLLDEVTFTRYRNAIIEDYASRLHYTSDWIADNIKKQTVEDVTSSLGGRKTKFNLNFMSTHPDLYIGLINNSVQVQKIREIENSLSNQEFFVISKEQIKSIEHKLHSGDIIAIATSKAGLDYSHIGLCYKEGQQARLLHASSSKKKVILDDRISNYVNSNKASIGITVLRPLEPKKE